MGTRRAPQGTRKSRPGHQSAQLPPPGRAPPRPDRNADTGTFGSDQRGWPAGASTWYCLAPAMAIGGGKSAAQAALRYLGTLSCCGGRAMVSHPRAPAGSDSIRPLNHPRPLNILCDAQAGIATAKPHTLVEQGVHRHVLQIQDTWRIDEEWWRAPIKRQYYRVLFDDYSLRTIYHDLVTGQWYAQAY